MACVEAWRDTAEFAKATHQKSRAGEENDGKADLDADEKPLQRAAR